MLELLIKQERKRLLKSFSSACRGKAFYFIMLGCPFWGPAGDCIGERRGTHMAVTELNKSRLRIVHHTGTDPQTGKIVHKTKNFSNIKKQANTDQLHAAAKAIASLQELTLVRIERHDEAEILEISNP